ncbi:MAG: LuxR family transcriptional regulator [Pseudomonadota bacterium]
MSETTLDGLITSVDAARDPGDLWHCAVDLLVAEGAATLCYHNYPRPSAESDPFVALHGWPEALSRRYLEDGLWRIDPMHRLARSSAGVVSWTDLYNQTDITPAQAEMIVEVEKVGLRGGIAFQVAGPRLRSGAISIGFDVPVAKLLPLAIRRLQVIAQTCHLRLCTLTPERDGPLPQLSPRERDIVDLIVMGASNKAIARDLGVSPHTVDTLIRRLFAKLGVSDRTSAAIFAIGAGMVLPQDVRPAKVRPRDEGSGVAP